MCGIGVGRCSVVGVHLLVISGRWAGLNGDRLRPILSAPPVVYIAICFGYNLGGNMALFVNSLIFQAHSRVFVGGAMLLILM